MRFPVRYKKIIDYANPCCKCIFDRFLGTWAEDEAQSLAGAHVSHSAGSLLQRGGSCYVRPHDSYVTCRTFHRGQHRASGTSQFFAFSRYLLQIRRTLEPGACGICCETEAGTRRSSTCSLQRSRRWNTPAAPFEACDWTKVRTGATPPSVPG